jgi:anti-sigma-K factor RskA
MDKHIIDLLPAYALGALEEEPTILVSEHLARCSACRAEFAGLEGVVDELALAAPDSVPSTGLKQALLDHIQPQPVVAPEPRPSWWEALSSLFRRSAPAWGLASLALIVALAAGNLVLWQRVDRMEAVALPGEMRIIALSGTEIAPDATGTIVISGDGEYGTLVVDNLPPLDAGHQYQLWLIENGERTSGGVFSVSHEGYGAMEITSPEPLSRYAAFGITVEPTGGSPGPTGNKVLGNTL